ncbi:MAG: branched-chain amino acid ABC transporter permease [Alphaproteobacteria bacterium]
MASHILGLGSPSQRPPLWWWGFAALFTVFLLTIPLHMDIAELYSITNYLVLALLALSMSFLWGYGGMLSFGQTAFFGLGGYTYAVMALNLGETTGAMAVAIVLPMIFAAILGYFMIYGRISDIYFSVITLVVTLILEKGIRATSGDQYVIGKVRLNGQNGIPTTPSLQVPWNRTVTLEIEDVYYLAAVLLVLTYIGLRLLLVTRFGRILVSLRENERRSELLGYDTRRYKWFAFIIAAGVAGLGGAMWGVWGNFVGPNMFNLGQAAQVVIWVIVGGKSTLIGPIGGTVAVQYLTDWLGTQGVGQVTLVLGIVLMVMVMLFQQGLLPTLGLLAAMVKDALFGARKDRARP